MPVHVAHNAHLLHQPSNDLSDTDLQVGKQINERLQKEYVFTTELDVPPVANAPHWHSFDAEFYILYGDLTITDGASGQQFVCSAGDRITVPARSIHSELSAGGYSILLGTSVPPDEFGDPVERPASTLSA